MICRLLSVKTEPSNDVETKVESSDSKKIEKEEEGKAQNVQPVYDYSK